MDHPYMVVLLMTNLLNKNMGQNVNKKEKGVNNQNNSSFYFVLFSVTNTKMHYLHYLCLS